MQLLEPLDEKDVQRFLAKCYHDPCTDCVQWNGAISIGGGKLGNLPYGRFWFKNRSWYVHRWTAKFIFGLDISGMHVDHVCQNTLCVNHIQVTTPTENWRLRHERQKDVLEPEILVPFYPEPDWYARLSKYA